jgi:DNA repair exonuclease SbcCD ATPase subunit
MTGQSVLSRISHWLRPGATAAQSRTPLMLELPLENQTASLNSTTSPSSHTLPVSTLLKPWARRDATLVQLQEGFRTLNELMTAVKENLDRQAQRQNELLQLLQNLPEALKAIPENARVQSETLKVVGEQLQRHNVHYHRLADVLEKVSDSAADHKNALDALHDRVETISQHDQSLVESMRSVSSAMTGVSQNTQTSAQVLDQLKNNAAARDYDLQWLLHRQGVRFTAMLSIAIFISVAALAAVCLIGWRLLP